MNTIMDTSLKYCPSHGYLVGAGDWIPTSPDTYNFGAPGVQVGCNQLLCGDCGAKVRAEQGWQDASPVGFDPASLCEAEDWSKVPGLIEGPMTLYVCRCNFLFVDLAVSIDLCTELAQETGPDFPAWSCGGHPPFQLPGEVAGRILWDADDVAEFAAEILAGAWRESKPNPIQNGWPGFLLWRLYAKLKDLPEGALVSKRALEALTSEDSVQRAVAIAFFKAFPTAPGGEQLSQIYLSRRDLFDGVPDPILGWQDLGLLLEIALQGRCDRTYDAAALQIIRSFLLADAPLNGLRFQLLREIDRVWLEEHRDEVLTAAPGLIDSWVYMVQAWPEEVLMQELEAIGRWTPVTREALRQAVQMQLQDQPEKRERIASRL